MCILSHTQNHENRTLRVKKQQLKLSLVLNFCFYIVLSLSLVRSFEKEKKTLMNQWNDLYIVIAVGNGYSCEPLNWRVKIRSTFKKPISENVLIDCEQSISNAFFCTLSNTRHHSPSSAAALFGTKHTHTSTTNTYSFV